MSPIKDPILTIRRVRNGFLLMPTPGAVGDDTMIAVGPMSLSDCVQAWADGRVPWDLTDEPRTEHVYEWSTTGEESARDATSTVDAGHTVIDVPITAAALEDNLRAFAVPPERPEGLASQRDADAMLGVLTKVWEQSNGETGDVASPAPADESLPQSAEPR